MKDDGYPRLPVIARITVRREAVRTFGPSPRIDWKGAPFGTVPGDRVIVVHAAEDGTADVRSADPVPETPVMTGVVVLIAYGFVFSFGHWFSLPKVNERAFYVCDSFEKALRAEI